MSAQPVNPNLPPDHVTVFIDGVEMAAPKGSMIIQAADKAGIPIPRFCYHDKLAIAANCRMCLVDVEKMGKPAPACATRAMRAGSSWKWGLPSGCTSPSLKPTLARLSINST